MNRTYAEVLVEQNCNGAMDTAYVYGTDRLSLDRFDGSTGYYLYDPKGSVTGITNSEGQICRSYRYGAFGEITYGAPQYENIYAYNGESYNPNVGSLYLRARYYNVATGAFFTEDSYLGNIREPLTLNRYVYCVGNPVNYVDPSGHLVPALAGAIIGGIGGFIVGTATEVGRLIDQGGDYDWQAGALNIGNSAMAGFVGGGVLGGTGNPALAGMAGGASYGLLDGVAHTDPQGSFADNSLMVLQSTAIGGMAGGVGGLAGGGVAGALAGTSLSMTTQVFLAGAAAGASGGSTARLLSGTGITPVTVTQDAFMGGANGLIFYGVASAYQQATAPKPSTTSLQERANLAAELSEAEGCEGSLQTIHNDILSSPRTGSALTVDKIKPIYEIDPKTGRDYIIQEYPAKPQAHGFTDIVDNYAGYATRIPIENGVLYQLEGSLNGVSGRFEWIIQDGQVTHRMFIQNGTMNGAPIKP